MASGEPGIESESVGPIDAKSNSYLWRVAFAGTIVGLRAWRESLGADTGFVGLMDTGDSGGGLLVLRRQLNLIKSWQGAAEGRMAGVWGRQRVVVAARGAEALASIAAFERHFCTASRMVLFAVDVSSKWSTSDLLELAAERLDSGTRGEIPITPFPEETIQATFVCCRHERELSELVARNRRESHASVLREALALLIDTNHKAHC